MNNTIIIAVYCIHTYTPLIYTVQRVYLSLSEVSKGEFTDKMKISLNEEKRFLLVTAHLFDYFQLCWLPKECIKCINTCEESGESEI